MRTTIPATPTTAQGSDAPNLGPGAIVTKDASSNVIFLLSRSEWLDLQVYVNNTLALPTTEVEMRETLGLEEGETLPDFSALLAVYSDMNKHCTKWKKHIFPESVSIANNIVDYSTQAARFYASLRDLAAELRKNPENEEARQKFKEVVEELAEEAKDHARKAKKVAENIAEFAANTEQDKTQLSAVNDDYDKRFGAMTAEGKRLKADLEQQYRRLDKATQEYNQAVAVAATSPTYAWVCIPPLPPVGLIIAVIISGVYGDRAVKAKQEMDAAFAQIRTIGSQIGTNAAILANLARADQGLDSILQQLTQALPVIEKIRDVWTGLTADLTKLGMIIDDDIKQALPMLANLGIDAAIEQWAVAGRAADRYRVNAYIDVQSTVKVA